jgi:hypothetical protein
MPPPTRRAVLAAVSGLVALAGCSGKRDPSDRTTRRTETTQSSETAHQSQTTHRPQASRRGWVGLDVENNDDAPHEVTAGVERGGELRFERTLSLRPQAEPEFNAVVPVPDSGAYSVGLSAEMDAEASASETFTIAPEGDPQRLFVTIDREGVLQLTQGTEPSEPIPTSERA